jgi:2-oxoglutarate ferredoxin oxidoreductase subunit gamma
MSDLNFFEGKSDKNVVIFWDTGGMKMTEDLIIAGFGGQGVMKMGQLIAYSGLEEGKNVLWVPAYGPETRGGFANCTVIVSDSEIGSPVVAKPKSIIVLNRPSLDRFENSVQPGGTLVVNTSMAHREVERTDINVVKVPATEIATELGSQMAANIVALGAFIEAKQFISVESVKKSLRKMFASKPEIVALNEKALDKGIEIIRKQMAASA